jgi:hypothetical protein
MSEALFGFPAMPTCSAQAAMKMIVTAELGDRAVALWKDHTSWMQKSHYKDGKKKILFYHVCVADELDVPTDGPKADKTGRKVVTIIQFYKNKAGLDNHFAKFHAGEWKGAAKYQALLELGAEFSASFYGETVASIALEDFLQT